MSDPSQIVPAATLSDGTKVKQRVLRQRACNEKNDKGKLCAGHLKRWYFFGEEVKQKFDPLPAESRGTAAQRHPLLLTSERRNRIGSG
jgi:hypothetical protein